MEDVPMSGWNLQALGAVTDQPSALRTGPRADESAAREASETLVPVTALHIVQRTERRSEWMVGYPGQFIR